MPLPVLGCHQGDTWAGWEEGALLVPTAVEFTPGPPLLPLGIARASAARGSCRVARGRKKPASRIPHPASRTQGSRGVSGRAAQPHIPVPAAGFWHDTCILVNAWAFGESWQKLSGNGRSQHRVRRALAGLHNPRSCQARARLPGPPEQGSAGLGDGIQLLEPQPGSGSRFALEGTIKKHFALQLKTLIKICEHVNGEGKKGSTQFSPFAIAFLLDS